MSRKIALSCPRAPQDDGEGAALAAPANRASVLAAPLRRCRSFHPHNFKQPIHTAHIVPAALLPRARSPSSHAIYILSPRSIRDRPAGLAYFRLPLNAAAPGPPAAVRAGPFRPSSRFAFDFARALRAVSSRRLQLFGAFSLRLRLAIALDCSSGYVGQRAGDNSSPLLWVVA